MLTRVSSPLPDQLEDLISRTIGCCIAVHRALGPGLNESAYQRALVLELLSQDISFETEEPVTVRYRERVVCRQRIDLIVAGQLVVEIKSVDRIHPVHIAQTVSYLHATGLRAGVVINFNVPTLPSGIRRVVL
jgi:GxxExxY protein